MSTDGPYPKINVRQDLVRDGKTRCSTFLDVVATEKEDDGSLTVVVHKRAFFPTPSFTDSEMLDWLARNRTYGLSGSDMSGWRVHDASNGLTFLTERKNTFREAICAAMKRLT